MKNEGEPAGDGLFWADCDMCANLFRAPQFLANTLPSGECYCPICESAVAWSNSLDYDMDDEEW